MSYHLRCGQQPPSKQNLQDYMPNCDPSIYVHHVASLCSGSDNINGVYFHPLSVCLLRSRIDCGAEGSSCLQAVPVEVFLLLWSIPCVALWVVQRASQADSLSQTCFSLTFVSLCWPEGTLSSWTKFASLPFISTVAGCSCFGWHTAGLSLPWGCEYGCVFWGESARVLSA